MYFGNSNSKEISFAFYILNVYLNPWREVRLAFQSGYPGKNRLIARSVEMIWVCQRFSVG